MNQNEFGPQWAQEPKGDIKKDKKFWMEQLRMNSNLSVAEPSIFEKLESYGDVFSGTEETDQYPLPRNPIIEDTILDGKHCDVYLIDKTPNKPDIFIYIGKEATPEELRRAESERKSFKPLSTDNWQSDKNQADAEKHEG